MFGSELTEFLGMSVSGLPIAEHTDTYKRREGQSVVCAKVCTATAEAHYHIRNYGRWLDLCPAHNAEWLLSQEATPFTG